MTEVSAILEQRGARYGLFADHAAIAQGIQDVMRATENWPALDPDMRQALTVIADKIARILNGDKDYDDNWIDIQGYAKLVADRLTAEALKAKPEQEEKVIEVKASDIPVQSKTSSLKDLEEIYGDVFRCLKFDKDIDSFDLSKIVPPSLMDVSPFRCNQPFSYHTTSRDRRVPTKDGQAKNGLDILKEIFDSLEPSKHD